MLLDIRRSWRYRRGRIQMWLVRHGIQRYRFNPFYDYGYLQRLLVRLKLKNPPIPVHIMAPLTDLSDLYLFPFIAHYWEPMEEEDDDV